MSPRVDCHIYLVFDGKELLGPYECTVNWIGLNTFRSVDDIALQLPKDRHSTSETTQLYRKSGRCRLINDKTGEVEDSRIGENRGQWAEAILQMVRAHLHKTSCDAYHLEICLEYSTLSISALKGESYVTTVHNVVYQKLKRNWEHDVYIPRGDLEQIFSESTIKSLIDADQSLANLHLTAEARAKFFKNVNLNATRFSLFVSKSTCR